MTIQLTEKELTWCEGQAQKRHDKKNMRFRNTGILMENVDSSKHKFYLPHLTGIVGEKAYGKLIGAEVDTRLYDVRDEGEDFKGVEVKTITYFGAGEPELKIKKAEYESKTPELYVLARVKTNCLRKVELLGKITRKNFDIHKKSKQYGVNKPENWVVGLSSMEPFVNKIDEEFGF